METDLSSPRASITRNPIPAPTITVRSEFPTLNRSRQQQSLACLVTIEVPEGNWRPNPEDLRGVPQLPAHQPEANNGADPRSPVNNRPGDWPYEPPEVLEELTEDLRQRVDNWHGLDFSRYVMEVVRRAASTNHVQIRQTASSWKPARRKGPSILAGTRVFSLRGDADLRQREEGRPATIRQWRLEAQTHEMYA